MAGLALRRALIAGTIQETGHHSSVGKRCRYNDNVVRAGVLETTTAKATSNETKEHVHFVQ